MNLRKAIDNACEELPDGYHVVLYMGNGAAWIELKTPDGTQSVESGESIEDDIIAAVQQAKEDG